MRRWVVVYDIGNDERRQKIFGLMKDFGHRVQYSVFECKLRDEDLLLLQAKLEELMDRDEDNVVMYRLCARCERDVRRMGKAPDPAGETIIII